MEPVLRVLLMVGCLAVCAVCVRGVTLRYAAGGARQGTVANVGLGVLAALAWLAMVATLVVEF
jgi:hypothetical protein